jgi:DtxR family Mn-dependent transcriptional regulator
MSTTSTEEYLLAIYRLQGADSTASTTDLAAHLSVAPASVTGMVRRLKHQGLVEHRPYRGVTLTPPGRRAALRLIRAHRLWELFLVRVLRMPWDEVHAEAHRLEHALSDRLADRLAAFLNDPEYDPHGQPIPSPDGGLPARVAVSLSDVEAGRSVVLLEVPDGDAELLRYLGDLHVVPGAQLEVVAVGPFGGPLTVQVGDARHALARELARQLLVTYPTENTH